MNHNLIISYFILQTEERKLLKFY